MASAPSLPSTSHQPPIPQLIGSSAAMRQVYRVTRQAARSDASVLLLGETGTGKELIAAALHQLSRRASGPLVKVNCGALTESLLESELFGHVRGSFTDAIQDRTGRFEAAHTGTIFLDEINSTSSVLQVKLLRVLQEREFERVGDSRTIRIDVRVVAASNRDLPREVAEGRFREDLFWRLNVVPITLPPLRERREDILPLAQHFLEQYGRRNGRKPLEIHPEALQQLVQYHWPGNVRELQNYIERAVVMAEGPQLTLDLLPDSVSGRGSSTQLVLWRPDPQQLVRQFVEQQLQSANGEVDDLHQRVVRPVERELLSQIMQQCQNVQIKAAQLLGMNRNTLHKKLKEHGLDGG